MSQAVYLPGYRAVSSNSKELDHFDELEKCDILYSKAVNCELEVNEPSHSN